MAIKKAKLNTYGGNIYLLLLRQQNTLCRNHTFNYSNNKRFAR